MKRVRNYLMHKLRKPNKESPQSRPYEAEVLKSGGAMQSRTMIYARAAAVDLNPLQVTPKTVPIPAIPLSAKPKTVTERYWAERAITAETLLSVKAARHEEARVLAVTEAQRHLREMAAVYEKHESSWARLSIVTMVLGACVFSLAPVVLYFMLSDVNNAKKSRSSWPVHFTIPILSPFTSVVEHETSVITSRTIAIIGLVCGCLAYACFRYWVTYRVAAGGIR